jgi:protein-disulfide isomerase/uncharacterized membrane protein
MKNKINILMVSLLISVGLFTYLTIHHYQVQLGTNGSSICAINSKINCDAAALSSYAEVFNTPVAVFGLVFSLVMLIVVFLKKRQWIDFSESSNGFIKALFIGAAVVSVVMALISFLKVQVICPFCFATYLTSFLNAYLAFSIFSPSEMNPVKMATTKANINLAIILLVALWFVSAVLKNQYGLEDIRKNAPEKVALWKNSASYTFENDKGLILNPGAEHTVVEFADFKCSHCKVASESLHSFMKTNSNVTFVFKPFPLDGVCNPHIPQKGDGSRCKMAAWTLCAEKINQKGWDVHKWYFDHQEDLFSVSDLTETHQKISKEFSLSYDQIEQCSTSVETNDLIKKMTDEGKAANVQGTPSIYLNSKRVEFRHGQLNYLLNILIKEKI